MGENKKIFLVIKNYKSPYPSPLKFSKGERILIKKEFTEDPDWKNWLWCEGENDNQAWIPIEYIKREENSGFLSLDYDARELSVKIGENLSGYEEMNGFVKAEKMNGEKGWVPLRNLELIKK